MILKNTFQNHFLNLIKILFQKERKQKQKSSSFLLLNETALRILSEIYMKSIIFDKKWAIVPQNPVLRKYLNEQVFLLK